MMDAISWGEFLQGLATVLVFYYCYVLIRYFRPEFSGILNKIQENSATTLSKGTSKHDGLLMEKLAKLIDEIDTDVIPICSTSEELLGKLRIKLQILKGDEGLAVRSLLARHILLSAQVHALAISEEDIQELLDLPHTAISTRT
ncbi:hypothetical protein LZF95_23130 [Algoriphagus sp. AGSA1]|uniref:hypothetical protein n=1 Tax=unclassified Algoriphagus TaxID=2641541 RepID=UPI00177E26F5|nr:MULTISPECIES: hypothetical protein [unclassified Algoriphagus]MCE7057594.1 hypothetical protein [Algoriphagus sp. AGSA1]